MTGEGVEDCALRVMFSIRIRKNRNIRKVLTVGRGRFEILGLVLLFYTVLF